MLKTAGIARKGRRPSIRRMSSLQKLPGHRMFVLRKLIRPHLLHGSEHRVYLRNSFPNIVCFGGIWSCTQAWCPTLVRCQPDTSTCRSRAHFLSQNESMLAVLFRFIRVQSYVYKLFVTWGCLGRSRHNNVPLQKYLGLPFRVKLLIIRSCIPCFQRVLVPVV